MMINDGLLNAIMSKWSKIFKFEFLKILSLKSKIFKFISCLMSNPCPLDHSQSHNVQVHICSFLTGVSITSVFFKISTLGLIPGYKTRIKEVVDISFSSSQRAEEILNKISNNINKTYTGLTSVLQGFQKCIA